MVVHPAATAAKPAFGVFNMNGTPEDTGIDRMLGTEDDRFYGSSSVAFMYGNGGNDVIYDQAGIKASGSDGVANPDQWKEYARRNDRVWYVPATNGDSEIAVELVNGELAVSIVEHNNGAQTGKSIYKPSDTMWSSRPTSAEQVRVQAVVNPGGYVANTLARSGLVRQSNGWAGPMGGPTSVDDFDVILVDAFGGNDVVKVEPGVYKTVWIDGGGAGNDTITINAKSAILPNGSKAQPTRGSRGATMPQPGRLASAGSRAVSSSRT